MKLNSALLMVIALFGTGVQVQANLLTNASFESPGASLTTNYASVGSGTAVTGWTTQVSLSGGAPSPAGSVFYAASNNTASWLPNASNGNYFVQLDSTNACCGNYTVGSSIAQSFNVTQGVTYRLTFDLNNEVNQGGASQALVSFTGAGYQTANAQAFTISQAAGNGTTKANTLWFNESYTFTATATGSTTLKFTDGPGCNNNVSLDNISVEVVPEFSHWAVFAGFGLLVAGGRQLRRRRGDPVTV